jgi:hypothetical protein
MEVMHVTVDATKFRLLGESEQLFLVRLGQIHNDIRHIRQMVITAHNGVKAYKGIEHEIALHLLIFAVRLGAARSMKQKVLFGLRGTAANCRGRCRASSMQMPVTP